MLQIDLAIGRTLEVESELRAFALAFERTGFQCLASLSDFFRASPGCGARIVLNGLYSEISKL